MVIHHYTKLYEVIEKYNSVIAIVDRFGIVPGYGSRTIKECAEAVGVDFNLVLEVINIFVNPCYVPSQIGSDILLSSVVEYIDKGYDYLINSQLYNLEKHISPLLSNPHFSHISTPFDMFKQQLISSIKREQNENFPQFLKKCDDFKECSHSSSTLLLSAGVSSVNKSVEMISDIRRALLLHAGAGMNINLFNAVIFTLSNFESHIFHLQQVKDLLLYPISGCIDSILEQNVENLPVDDGVLSIREREVLRFVALGRQNKEIASLLNISVNTVLSHRKNIISKLDIRTVSALTYYALVNKIVSEQELRNI
ncbi:MAG: LuxR C-terminal-related transcriptional regulator [Rikenellaceae bacterium]